MPHPPSRFDRRALLLHLGGAVAMLASLPALAGVKRGGGSRTVWPDGGSDRDPRDPECGGRSRSLAPDGPTDADPADRPGRGRMAPRPPKDSDPLDPSSCRRPARQVPKPSDADPRDP